jgi:hypothetical protein
LMRMVQFEQNLHLQTQHKIRCWQNFK